jgi:hypothetical protein
MFKTVNSQSINTSEAMGRKLMLRSSSTTPMGLRTIHTAPHEYRQLSMFEGFNASTRIHLDRAWASALYEANILFNVIWHLAFVYAVRETTKHWMLAYIPLSYYNALYTSLLKAKIEDVAKKTIAQLGDSLHKYGVTLCADGWNNVQNHLLLKIIQTGTHGDFFIGTIETIREHKDVQYIAKQISTFVAKVGPDNVVQICIDNAATMANTGCTVGIPSYGVVKKVVQSDGFHEIFTFAIFSLNFQRRLMQ